MTLAGPGASDAPWTAALQDAWRREAPRIRRRLALRVGEADADDLAHDVFERAHRARPEACAVVNVSAWLHGIATHAAIDWLRARGVREREASRLAVHLSSGGEGPADAALDRARMRGCIAALVERLPPGQRAVMSLAEIDGLSDRETAQALGLTVGAVKIRLHRGRRALRALMECECRTFRDERNELGCAPVRPAALPVVR